MSEEMIDPVLICFYCGDMMDYPNQNQLKILGNKLPKCCKHEMLKVDRNNLWEIIKGIDKLKETIENEMIKGI